MANKPKNPLKYIQTTTSKKALVRDHKAAEAYEQAEKLKQQRQKEEAIREKLKKKRAMPRQKENKTGVKKIRSGPRSENSNTQRSTAGHRAEN